MNRSALKSAGFVFLGVVLGWGIGRLPKRSGGTGTANDRSSEVVVQRGPAQAPAPHGRPKGSSSGAATVGAGGRPDLERLEAIFRREDKNVTTIDAVMEAATMPAEEIAPLLAHLAEEEVDVRALELLAVRWAMLDPKAALAFALGRGDLALSWDMMSRIVGELAKVDLSAAKAALNKLDGEMRTDAERAIVRVLRERDSRAALAYARELGDEEAEADVLKHMAESDPLGAAAELVPGRVPHRRAVEGIAVALLAKDRAAFETWAGSLGDPVQRSVAFSAALTMDAATDPRSAALGMATWLAKDTEASAHAGDLAAELAGKWTGTGGQPAEVAAWALSLPEGPTRNGAVAEAGRRWLDQDTMAASAWLRSLPQGAGKDSTVLRLVRKISGDTPADAFEWARTVETPNLRDEALNEALRNWARQDTAAAEQAVETLPENDRSRLQRVVAEEEEKMGSGE